MDSNNKIEPCLSRKSSEGKPQIFTTLRNIDLTLLTILKLHMSIKESLMQRKCLICPPSAIYQPIQKLRVIFPDLLGNDSNLLIVFYVQIMPDDLVMQLHRF